MISQVYSAKPEPSLLSKKVTVTEVVPILGSLPPSVSKLPGQFDLYLRGPFPRLTGGLQRKPTLIAPETIDDIVKRVLQNRVSRDSTTVPARSAPEKGPQEVPRLAGQPAPEPVKLTPIKIASGAAGVIKITSDMTRSQVTEYLKIAGAKGDDASRSADAILAIIKSKEVTSILVGVVAGGLVFALLGKVHPKGDKRLHYTIAALVAVVVAIFVYTRQTVSTPFVGTWSLQPGESQYEVGEVPRGATCTMGEEAGGLKVVEDMRPTKGKEQHLSYILYADGKDHSVSGSNGADVSTTTFVDHGLETVIKRRGEIVRRETRVLSSDLKQLTVTVLERNAKGGELKNVSVYEKK